MGGRASRARTLAAFAVGATLALGALLRLWRLDLAPFTYDEAAAASLLVAWWRDGLLPLTGIHSSAGVPQPLGWLVLLAPGFLLSPTPLGLVALGPLAGLAGLAATWWVARRWYGLGVAALALAWLAVGFWPVYVGRRVWQQALLPAFAALCLDALLLLAVRRRPWALALACGWLGIMVNLHLLTAGYLLLVIAAAVAARACLRPRHLAAAGLALLVPLAPYLAYELHPAVRLRDVRHLLAAGQASPVLDTASLRAAWDLFGAGGAAYYLGEPVAAPWAALAAAGSLTVLAGVATAVVAGDRPRWRNWLVAACVALPVLLLARHALPVYLHYLYVTLPAAALVAAALLHRLWRTLPARPLAAALLAAYIVGSLGGLVGAADGLARHPDEDAYGIPLGSTLAAAEAVRARLPAGGVARIGAHYRDAEPLRFALGAHVPTELFDPCTAPPPRPGAVSVLLSERTACGAERDLASRQPAPPLRLPRPGGDAYLLFGPEAD